MAYILGIDTGGTYTDGVIYDADRRRIVARAKALTTYDNLATGIGNCIAELAFDELADVRGVCLSTTLATNAIVEGRGCAVGLLLIGHGQVAELPTALVEVVGGGHDVKGLPQADLDPAEVRAAVARLRSRVEGLAVSGYFSVRNPDHELKVREIVTEMLGVPVVCAHQLTTSLGFQERTVTAVLNARLIPIITGLIGAVKAVMVGVGINAPLMIVKGDGTLMSEAKAKEKPIDTILSGPAASIIGSTVLAGRAEAVVADMGGTTTDIAIIQGGVPRLNPEGAVVGSWLTRVEAAQVYTYGLGGDSYLQVNSKGEIVLGPQKVWPLAVAARQYPHLPAEIRNQAEKKRARVNFQPTDCYLLIKNDYRGSLSELEKGALRLLADGPHSLLHLSERLQDRGLINLQRLVDARVVVKISLTPTDILHARGAYTDWDVAAARLGVKVMADELGVSAEEFAALAMNAVVERLSVIILQSLLAYEECPPAAMAQAGEGYLREKLLHPEKDGILSIVPRLKLPLIAMGAPVGAFFPAVAAKLQAELIVPADAAVANAVGAASGKVVERVKILFKPMPEGGVIMHAPWERKVFGGLEEAKSYAAARGREWVAGETRRMGGGECQIDVACDDKYVGAEDQPGQRVFLESRMEIVGLGYSAW